MVEKEKRLRVDDMGQIGDILNSAKEGLKKESSPKYMQHVIGWVTLIAIISIAVPSLLDRPILITLPLTMLDMFIIALFAMLIEEGAKSGYRVVKKVLGAIISVFMLIFPPTKEEYLQ